MHTTPCSVRVCTLISPYRTNLGISLHHKDHLEGQVHPQKIYWVCLMCSCNSIYWLMGQATITKPTWASMCWLTKAFGQEPSLWTSSHRDLKAAPTKDHLACTFSDTPCRSCMSTQDFWQTSAAFCSHDSLPQYSHMSHSLTDSVRPHFIGQMWGLHYTIKWESLSRDVTGKIALRFPCPGAIPMMISTTCYVP